MMIVNFSESRFITGGRISYSEINDFFGKRMTKKAKNSRFGLLF